MSPGYSDNRRSGRHGSETALWEVTKQAVAAARPRQALREALRERAVRLCEKDAPRRKPWGALGQTSGSGSGGGLAGSATSSVLSSGLSVGRNRREALFSVRGGSGRGKTPLRTTPPTVPARGPRAAWGIEPTANRRQPANPT